MKGRARGPSGLLPDQPVMPFECFPPSGQPSGNDAGLLLTLPEWSHAVSARQGC